MKHADLIDTRTAVSRYSVSPSTLIRMRVRGKIFGYDRRGMFVPVGTSFRGGVRYYSTAELDAALDRRDVGGRPARVPLFDLIPESNRVLVMTELWQGEETLVLADALRRLKGTPEPARRELTDAELDAEQNRLEREYADALLDTEDGEDGHLYGDPVKVLPGLLDRLESRIGYDRLRDIVESLIEHGPAVTARMYPFTTEPEFERDRRRRSEREQQHDEGSDADEVRLHLMALTADED